EVVAKHKKEADTVKRTIRDLEKVRDDPMTSGADSMKLDALIRDNIARHDKLQADLQERLRTLTDDHVVAMYKDLDSMCKRFGAKNGFSAVLGYGDADQEEELLSAENIDRKTRGMDVGSLTPLYLHADVDVTDRIIAALNEAAARGAK